MTPPGSSGPILVSMALAGLVTYLVVPPLVQYFERRGHTQENYRGKRIPTSLGLVFPFVVAASLGPVSGPFLRFIQPPGGLPGLREYLFLIHVFAFIGLLDDLVHDEARGFIGHLGRLLLQGSLSAGAFKLLAGGAAALVVGISLGSRFSDVIAITLLIALSANTLNLLDLRPGRSIKAFFFLGGVLSFSGGGDLVRWTLLPLMSAVIVYAPWDLSARGMLGDAGSNVLGAALGFALALRYEGADRLGILLLLAAVQVIAEKYSFSQLIERSSWLQRLDAFGRKEEGP